VENERLKQSAVEVAKLNQPNLEQIMALSVEVESLKAKLAAPSAGEGQGFTAVANVYRKPEGRAMYARPID
jgi:hypothetical protein